MNCHQYDNSKEDLTAMDLLADMEFEYVADLDLNSSGHTDATTMTCMSEDQDEDEEIGRMLEEENFPYHFLEPACLDPVVPRFLPEDAPESNNAMPTSTSRENLWARSTCANLRNASLGSRFSRSIGTLSISSTIEAPSLKSVSSSSASYNTDYSGAVVHHGVDPSNKQSSPTAVGVPPPPLPKSKAFGMRRRSSSSSQGRRRRPKRKDRCQQQRSSMPVKEGSSQGLLVGDLAFEHLCVTPPDSPATKKGKLSSAAQHPLAKMKEGIRSSMKKLAAGSSSNYYNKRDKKQEQQQLEPKLAALQDRQMKVVASCDAVSAASNPTKKKRTRRKEPLQKQHVCITDLDVLLGRGGLSNHHPGNQAYRKHILLHQKEYKMLENTAKTQLSKAVVAWVKARGGRFLKRDDEVPGQPFYVATDRTAREKVSQALREDHTPEGRKLKKSRTKSCSSSTT